MGRQELRREAPESGVLLEGHCACLLVLFSRGRAGTNAQVVTQPGSVSLRDLGGGSGVASQVHAEGTGVDP